MIMLLLFFKSESIVEIILYSDIADNAGTFLKKILLWIACVSFSYVVIQGTRLTG